MNAPADPRRHIQDALDALVKAVPRTKIGKPPSARAVAKLVDEAGALAPEMDAYFACCNGVVVPEVGRLFSLAETMDVDTPGYFAISDDGFGNYDLVAATLTTGPGAVLFRDHETDQTEHLVASSLSVYVTLWTRRAIAGATGKKDPSRGKWPFDAAFMQKHDPAGAKLAASPRFKKQLGEVELAIVDRKGKVGARTVVNPFTGEPMVLPALPTRRRRP